MNPVKDISRLCGPIVLENLFLIAKNEVKVATKREYFQSTITRFEHREYQEFTKKSILNIGDIYRPQFNDTFVCILLNEAIVMAIF